MKTEYVYLMIKCTVEVKDKKLKDIPDIIGEDCDYYVSIDHKGLEIIDTEIVDVSNERF
jgi:hypothetical protein